MSKCKKCGSELTDGKCRNCESTGIENENNTVLKSREKKKGRVSKPKTLALIIASIIILAAVAVCLVVFLNMNAQYNKAIEKLRHDDPYEAAEIFEDLGWFKKSEDYLEKCLLYIDYLDAVDAMENEEYEEAIEIFEELDDYKDADKLLIISENYIEYNKAMSLFDDQKHEEAKEIFDSLGDFEDSSQMARDCQVRIDYEEACRLFEAGDNIEAKLLFDGLAGYEDSSMLALACGLRIAFDEARGKMSSGEYEEALLLLDNINDDADKAGIAFDIVMDEEEFIATRQECYQYTCYNKGKAYFEQELFYSAYKQFIEASGVLDANEMAQSCIQTFSTSEIYSNPKYSENETAVIFKVAADVGMNVCMKIYDNYELVSMSIIKPGEQITVWIPSGVYSFNQGRGTDWFGEKDYFGEEGTYVRFKFSESSRLAPDLPRLILLTPIFTHIFEFKSGDAEDGNIEEEIIRRSEF